MAWFKLTGSNPTQASNYTLVQSEPEDCTTPKESICAIQAMSDIGNNPVITEALKDEMIIALHNGIPSDNVLLKARV